MRVTILNQLNSINKSTREDIQGRISRSLKRFNTDIDEVAVTVRIGTAAEASRASRTLCRLSVRMKKIGSFLVECIEDSLPEAVSQAAERAARRLKLILDRR